MNTEQFKSLMETQSRRKVGYLRYNQDKRRKLTEEDILNIIRLYSEGRSITELSEIFGVVQLTIKYWIDEDFRRMVLDRTRRRRHDYNPAVARKSWERHNKRYKKIQKDAENKFYKKHRGKIIRQNKEYYRKNIHKKKEYDRGRYSIPQIRGDMKERAKRRYYRIYSNPEAKEMRRQKRHNHNMEIKHNSGKKW